MQTDIVAKTVILNDRHEVLVLRRSQQDDHRPGGWDLPGGKVESDESVHQGAVREAAEESGILLEDQSIQLVYSVTAYDNSRQINLVRMMFLAATDDPQVSLSDEHDHYEWMSFKGAVEALDGTSWCIGMRYVHEHHGGL